jgi:hypothetical protein
VTAALRAHLRAYPPGPAGLVFTTPARTVLNPATWRHRIWRPLAPVRARHPGRHHLSTGSGTLTPPCSATPAAPDHDIQRRHARPGEIRWYRHPYPGPGDNQATRDAIDTALSGHESSALAC